MKFPFGFKPRKRLGQHFLVDDEIIHNIINRGGFHPSDRVLEIGPGMGSLTIPLASQVCHITAVEKDPVLVEILNKRLTMEGIENVRLIDEDILRFGLENFQDPSMGSIRVVGNLPYNISSPIMEEIIRHRKIISNAIFMFQHEFARRLTARPGGREYGALSAIIQYYSTVTPLLDVPQQAFYPRPRVGSMVVYIDMEKPHYRRADNESHYRKIVRAAFAHKRKTILNSLKNELRSIDSVEISAALEKCSIDPRRRAETLAVDEFIDLASALDYK